MAPRKCKRASWCTDAGMWAVAEGHVRVSHPRDVQFVGLVEPRLVTVRRAEPDEQRLVSADPLAAEFQILAGPARGELDLALVAQEFLHRGFEQRGVLTQLLKLVGVACQAQDTVGQGPGDPQEARPNQENGADQELRPG